MFVPTRVFLTDCLTILKSAGATGTDPKLFGSKIGLIKADFTPTPDLVLGGITEADFDGYAKVAAAPFSAVFEGEGDLELVSAASKHWQPTGSVTPNTIYGWFLVDSGGTILLGTEKFDSPIALNGSGFAFDHTARFGFDPNANFGAAVIG
jgi:hypothetical protein